MLDKVQDDDLVMSLVDLALARPPAERQSYLRSVCDGDSQLFEQVLEYVRWEERMQGFMLDPLYTPDDLQHPFEPGQLLDGRFRIVREVADGGMGVVYEARDERLDRRIAIKCAKAGFRKRLPPEVRHAREIAHPNVCKIFEIHTASISGAEVDFITMEFLEGETLSERLTHGPPAAKEARTIAAQLCAGLAEAHRNQVIHGDLKSGNIILTTTADGATRAVITDFGLARGPEASQGTLPSGAKAGTPDYMAPELWKGAKASIASDIYALGVILYELFSGRRPFPAATIEQQVHGKPPAVHSNWDWVLARCLDPNPARRFPDAGEIARALESGSRRRFLAVAAAVAASCGLGTGVYWQGNVGKAIPSIAVIPFVNDRGTAENEYLSDGISEGLINALTQLPDVKVIAGSSSFKFKGTTIDVRNAAQTLGVQVLAMGRVTVMDGQLRITAELVNADGTQIWGAQYDRKISDMAILQAEISREIAQRIRSKLTSSERAKLERESRAKPEAYEWYLRGRYQMRLYTPESRQKAVDYYQQALAVDPGFAVANAELAYTYRLLSGGGIRSAADMMPKAEAAARRALAADPDLPEAHAALADIKKDQWDWLGAEREYRRALKLSPNLAVAHHGFAIYLSVTGRYNDAFAEIQRARELDPIGLAAATDTGAVYYNARRYQDALDALKRATDSDPDATAPWTWFGIVYGGSGQAAKAIEAFERAIALGDDTAATQCLYAYSLARAGRRGQAIQILDRIQRSGKFVPPTALAMAYAGLYQKETALLWLQTAYSSRDPLLQYMQVESHYDILKDDERFKNLAGKVGLPR